MTVGAVLSDATSLMCQEGKRPQDPEGANFIPIRYVKRVTFEPSAILFRGGNFHVSTDRTCSEEKCRL